jgi:hypothetical protein
MPVVDDSIKELLREISKLVLKCEDEYSKLPTNDRMFGKKLAVGHYHSILNNKSLTPDQQLREIYDIACRLAGSHDPKFNWTPLHSEIKSKASRVFVDESKKVGHTQNK